jgi:hypothetical protein
VSGQDSEWTRQEEMQEVVSGQEAPAGRCPLEQQLLGRRLQWHGKGKAPVRFETTHSDDSAGAASPHSNCAAVQLQDHMQSGLQEEC